VRSSTEKEDVSDDIKGIIYTSLKTHEDWLAEHKNEKVEVYQERIVNIDDDVKAWKELYNKVQREAKDSPNYSPPPNPVNDDDEGPQIQEID
jgi:CRISPR/Cas system CSM-associated protein Csm4 (group 5 of RAMP superfamily)